MATPRTTRSSSASSFQTVQPSDKRSDSIAKKKNSRPRRAQYVSNSAAAYERSIAAVVRGIADIKRKLLDEAPSHEILDDFFEGVTSEPAFQFEFQRGPVWLKDAIARTCEEILDKPMGHSHVVLVAVPKYDLIHGSVVIDGYMGAAVFFQDIRLGAVGLYPEHGESGSFFVRLVTVNPPREVPDAPN